MARVSRGVGGDACRGGMVRVLAGEGKKEASDEEGVSKPHGLSTAFW